MNFTIYATGEKIEKFYLEAIKEYEKRLSRYCKIKFLHLKNEEELRKKLTDKSYKIRLSANGEKLTSEELASKIDTFGLTGISHVSFLIGSEALPHDESWAISSLEMALGLKMTLIFEQIYRSYRILNNEPYHK